MKPKCAVPFMLMLVFLSCGDDLSRRIETLSRLIVDNNNNIERIESLLKKDEYREIINDLPSDTIKSAAAHESVLVLLLDSGFNPNFLIADNESLLEWAIKNEPDIGDLLVRHGASLNLHDKQLVFTALDNMSDYFLGELFKETPDLLLVRDQSNISAYGAMLGRKRYTALMQLKNKEKRS